MNSVLSEYNDVLVIDVLRYFFRGISCVRCGVFDSLMLLHRFCPASFVPQLLSFMVDSYLPFVYFDYNDKYCRFEVYASSFLSSCNIGGSFVDSLRSCCIPSRLSLSESIDYFRLFLIDYFQGVLLDLGR